MFVQYWFCRFVNILFLLKNIQLTKQSNTSQLNHFKRNSKTTFFSRIKGLNSSKPVIAKKYFIYTIVSVPVTVPFHSFRSFQLILRVFETLITLYIFLCFSTFFNYQIKNSLILYVATKISLCLSFFTSISVQLYSY